VCEGWDPTSVLAIGFHANHLSSDCCTQSAAARGVCQMLLPVLCAVHLQGCQPHKLLQALLVYPKKCSHVHENRWPLTLLRQTLH
jgi:hypothetical protein